MARVGRSGPNRNKRFHGSRRFMAPRTTARFTVGLCILGGGVLAGCSSASSSGIELVTHGSMTASHGVQLAGQTLYVNNVHAWNALTPSRKKEIEGELLAKRPSFIASVHHKQPLLPLKMAMRARAVVTDDLLTAQDSAATTGSMSLQWTNETHSTSPCALAGIIDACLGSVVSQSFSDTSTGTASSQLWATGFAEADTEQELIARYTTGSTPEPITTSVTITAVNVQTGFSIAGCAQSDLGAASAIGSLVPKASVYGMAGCISTFNTVLPEGKAAQLLEDGYSAVKDGAAAWSGEGPLTCAAMNGAMAGGNIATDLALLKSTAPGPSVNANCDSHTFPSQSLGDVAQHSTVAVYGSLNIQALAEGGTESNTLFAVMSACVTAASTMSCTYSTITPPVQRPPSDSAIQSAICAAPGTPKDSGDDHCGVTNIQISTVDPNWVWASVGCYNPQGQLDCDQDGVIYNMSTQQLIGPTNVGFCYGGTPTPGYSSVPPAVLAGWGMTPCSSPSTTTTAPSALTAELLTCEPPSPLPAGEGGPGYDSPAVEPSDFWFICGVAGDPPAQFENLTWTSWSASSASGTGDFTTNDCVPDCASAMPVNYPVNLSLSQPVDVAGYSVPVFSLLTVDFSGTLPPSIGAELTEVTPTEYTAQFPMTCPTGCS